MIELTTRAMERSSSAQLQTWCTCAEVQLLVLKNTQVEVLIQLLYLSKSENVLTQSKKVKVAP